MWDLCSIIRNNNQAAVEYMMRGQKAGEVESSIPAVWTLESVAAKLQIGPPALSELMNCCMDFRKIQAFLELIREYLPENEEEILSQARDQRLQRFCYLFGKKYFPLPSLSSDADLGTFVASMPLMLAGMSHDAYHELDLRAGYLLLLSLVVYPYEGSEADSDAEAERVYETEHDFVTSLNGFVQVTPVKVSRKEAKNRKEQLDRMNGPRIPLLEKVRSLAGSELAKAIPVSGWDREWLHQATDGTKYDGVGPFADWACSRTGCTLLDSSYADCSYVEGEGEPVFLWSRGNVDMLTEEWPRVKQIRESIDRMVTWLEEDLERNFGELLSFLLSKEQPRGKMRNEYDECGHFCPLEQASRDDYDELEDQDE